MLLSRAEWRALGVSTRRLAGPDFVTVLPGYLTPAATPATVNEMCRVLQQRVLPGAVISHTTAALLYGLPLPWWQDDQVGLLSTGAERMHGALVVPSTMPVPKKQEDRPIRSGADLTADDLAEIPDPDEVPVEEPAPSREHLPLAVPPILRCRVDSPSRYRVSRRVMVHRKASAATFEFGGVRLSHPLVVLLELATMLDHDDLVIAVDAFERRRPKPPFRLITLEHVAQHIAASAGLTGAPALRRALRDARPNTDSPGETRTRLLLRRAGFPPPTLNLEVQDPDSRQPRYIDLSYPEHRVGIEYDGDGHRTDKDQWRKDENRKDSLESVGWKIRRLNADDIKDPVRFLSALRRTLHAAGAVAPPASKWAGAAGKALSRPLVPRDDEHGGRTHG